MKIIVWHSMKDGKILRNFLNQIFSRHGFFEVQHLRFKPSTYKL